MKLDFWVTVTNLRVDCMVGPSRSRRTSCPKSPFVALRDVLSKSALRAPYVFQVPGGGPNPAAEEQAVSDLVSDAASCKLLCISAFKTTPQQNLWCRDRVVGPILQLKNELFQTFRQRRSIVSVQEYETDKASLERMLADFESDFAKSAKVLGSALCQGDMPATC